MKTFTASLLLALPLATSLVAQDGAPQMPDPKTEQHANLKMFVGTWKTETDTPALPGIPGMEKATKSSGIERAELICNGLWLKVTGDGQCNGQPSSGIWLLGYDPIAKSYQCAAASNVEEALFCFESTYDEKNKTWHFEGDTPMGPMRSELVMESADRCVETAYATGEDGEEVQFMRIVRTRTDDDADIPAKAGAVPASSKDMPAARAAIHADAGTWDAEFSMEMPGLPKMTSDCKEVVEPICRGTWTWSTFTGNLMGAPFEGHALVGYDSRTEEVTSLWIDSTTGAYMRTDGTYDEETESFEMEGTFYNEQGKRDIVTSKAGSTGENERRLEMHFGEGDTQSVMTIEYRRAK